MMSKNPGLQVHFVRVDRLLQWTLGFLLVCLSSTTTLAGPISFTTFDLAIPGATSITLQDAAKDGTVIGTYLNSGFKTSGFIRTPDGNITTFSNSIPSESLFLTAINDSGSTSVGAQGPFFSFPQTSGITIQNNNVLTVAPSAALRDVNDSGVAVGQSNGPGFGEEHLVKVIGGVVTQFDVPGSIGGAIYSINNLGQIAGEYLTPSGGSPSFVISGFITLTDGTFLTVNFPGAPWSYVTKIYDSGVIRGVYSTDAKYNTFNMFYGTPGNLMDLPVFPDYLSAAPFYLATFGEYFGTYSDGNGGTRGFIAAESTAPEPSSLLLCGFALMTLAVRFRFNSSRQV
jgi:hypothetical protein